VVKAWIDRLVAGRDLFDEATLWLSRQLDCPARELGQSLRAKSSVELAMFLESALPSSSATGVETACRWLLPRARDGTVMGDGLPAGLDASLAEYPRPWVRVLAALGALILQERQPVLALICRGDADGPEWFTRLWAVTRLSTELAIAQHTLSLALIVEPAAWNAYLRQAPESRVKAMLRESVIPLTDTPAEGIRRALAERLHNQAPGLDLDRSISRLIGDGASSELVDLFETAGQALKELGAAPPDPSQADRARSAAERFLFERLESLPETTGLFRLNESLRFRFGSSRAVEVDLAADSLYLVVEIDGYYHFQDPCSYRRDRRKDVDLQQHGYLVVRVLAEDVVCRLEEVLDTILAAVAFCRQQAHR
jgi:very-short-patch-repair endonuclease